MSIDGKIDKDVIYTYYAILFSRKEWNPAISNDFNEPGGNYAKWNKPKMEEKILHDTTSLRNLK